MTVRLTATERLERMLSIVPFIADSPGGCSIDEVCDRFDVGRDELISCLETVFMVGVHPYTPDALIDVVIDADHVQIAMPDWFRRPLQLTPDQRLALLIARRTFREIPGVDHDAALHRALDKVASTLDADRVPVTIDFDGDEDSDLERLRNAISASRAVSFDYFSFGRNERSRRTVEPWRVQLDRGHWYLEGRCRDADAPRIFRVDRIDDVSILDAAFEAPTDLPAFDAFPSASFADHVTLDLAPSARWAVAQYPVESVTELGDGRIRAVFAVATPAWLERLLLRLGSDATLVDASPEVASVGSDAARRLLALYRE